MKPKCTVSMARCEASPSLRICLHSLADFAFSNSFPSLLITSVANSERGICLCVYVDIEFADSWPCM